MILDGICLMFILLGLGNWINSSEDHRRSNYSDSNVWVISQAVYGS